MIIRCEQCSTSYELDEALLSAEGSPVQCSRCQHVFTVRPPAAGQTAPGIQLTQVVQAPMEPPRAAAVRTPTAVPAAASAHPPASASHQAPRFTPGQGSGPVFYRPSASQPSVSRPPLIRRDTVGVFESRLRWSHRWRWLAPALFVGLVAAGAVAFLLREAAVDPRAHSAHDRGLELAWRDDVSSLEEARAQLDEALRIAPRMHAARADRALVELLLAGALTEQATLAPGPGPEELRRKARALAEEAARALEDLTQAKLAPAEVSRARGVAATLGGERGEGKPESPAQPQGQTDPIVQALERSVEVRSGDRALRDRAVDSLRQLSAGHPELLRARYALARGQALSGRRADALGTVNALLAANPRHECALALKDGLLRSGPSTHASAPSAEARGGKAVAPPEKLDSTAGELRAGGVPPATAKASPPEPSGEPAVSPPAPSEVPGGAAAGASHPAGEGEPPSAAPRLRPAAVPEPEPVHGGG